MYVTYTLYNVLDECVCYVGQWPYPLSIARDQVFILRVQKCNVWKWMEYVYVIHPFRICHHYYQMLLYIYTPHSFRHRRYDAPANNDYPDFWSRFVFLFTLFSASFSFPANISLSSHTFSLVCLTFTHIKNYCAYMRAFEFIYILLSCYIFYISCLLTHFSHFICKTW